MPKSQKEVKITSGKGSLTHNLTNNGNTFK